MIVTKSKHTREAFARWIRSHRRRLGLTLHQLAAKVGVSAAAISNYEQQRHLPELQGLLEKFETLFGEKFSEPATAQPVNGQIPVRRDRCFCNASITIDDTHPRFCSIRIEVPIAVISEMLATAQLSLRHHWASESSIR